MFVGPPLLFLSLFCSNASAYHTSLGGLSKSSTKTTSGGKYIGFSYASAAYEQDGFEEVNPTAIIIKYGGIINKHVSIEGRIGAGLQEDSLTILGFDVDVEIDSFVGVYGVFHTSSSSNIMFYGILGITRGEATVSTNALGGLSIGGDDSGPSFGIGIDISGLNFEYMNYLSENDYELSAIGIGYTTRF